MSSSPRLTDHGFMSESWLKLFDNLSPSDKVHVLEQQLQVLRSAEYSRGSDASQRFHKALYDAADTLRRNQNELFQEDGLAGIIGIHGASRTGRGHQRGAPYKPTTLYGANPGSETPDVTAKDFLFRALFTIGAAVARCLPQDGKYLSSLVPSNYHLDTSSLHDMQPSSSSSSGSTSPTSSRVFPLGFRKQPHSASIPQVSSGVTQTMSSSSSHSAPQSPAVRIVHSRSSSSVGLPKAQPGSAFTYALPLSKSSMPSPNAELLPDRFTVLSDCVHVYTVEPDRCHRDGEHTRAFAGGHPLECDKGFSCFKCNAQPREYNEPSRITRQDRDYSSQDRIGFVHPHQITTEQGVVGYAVSQRESVYTILTQEDMKRLYGVYREGWYLCIVNVVIQNDVILCTTEVILHYSSSLQPPLEHAQIAANTVLYIHQHVQEVMFSYLTLSLRHASTLQYNEQNTLVRNAVDMIQRYRDPFAGSDQDYEDNSSSSQGSKLIPRLMKAVYNLVPSERIALYMDEETGAVNLMQQYRYNEEGMICEIVSGTNTPGVALSEDRLSPSETHPSRTATINHTPNNNATSQGGTTKNTMLKGDRMPRCPSTPSVSDIPPSAALNTTNQSNTNPNTPIGRSGLSLHRPASPQPIPIPRPSPSPQPIGNHHHHHHQQQHSTPGGPSSRVNGRQAHGSAKPGRLSHHQHHTPPQPSLSHGGGGLLDGIGVSIKTNVIGGSGHSSGHSATSPATSPTQLVSVGSFQHQRGEMMSPSLSRRPTSSSINASPGHHMGGTAPTHAMTEDLSAMVLDPSVILHGSVLLNSTIDLHSGRQSSHQPYGQKSSTGADLEPSVNRSASHNNNNNSGMHPNAHAHPHPHALTGIPPHNDADDGTDDISDKQLVCIVGADNSMLLRRVPWGHGVCGYVAATQCPRIDTIEEPRLVVDLGRTAAEWATNTQSTQYYSSTLGRVQTRPPFRPQHVLTIPILDSDANTIAVLQFFNKLPPPNTTRCRNHSHTEFSDSDQDLVLAIAPTIAAALAVSRLKQQAVQNDRKTRTLLGLLRLPSVSNNNWSLLFSRMAEITRDALSAEMVAIYLVEKGLPIKIARRYASPRVKARADEDMILYCATYGTGLNIRDAQEQWKAKESSSNGNRSVLTIPVRIQSETKSVKDAVGIIQVINKRRKRDVLMRCPPAPLPSHDYPHHTSTTMGGGGSRQHHQQQQQFLSSSITPQSGQLVSPYAYNNHNYLTTFYNATTNPTISSTSDDLRETINSSIGAFAHYNQSTDAAPTASMTPGWPGAAASHPVISGGLASGTAVGGVTQISLSNPPDFQDDDSYALRSSMSYHYDQPQASSQHGAGQNNKQCVSCGAQTPQQCQCNIYDDGIEGIQPFDQSDVEILIAISVHLSSTFSRSIFQVLFDSMTKQHAARYIDSDDDENEDADTPATYEDATVYSLLSFYSKDHQITSTNNPNNTSSAANAANRSRARRMSISNPGLGGAFLPTPTPTSSHPISNKTLNAGTASDAPASSQRVGSPSTSTSLIPPSTPHGSGLAQSGANTMSIGPSSLSRRGSIMTLVPLSLGAPYQAHPQQQHQHQQSQAKTTSGSNASAGDVNGKVKPTQSALTVSIVDPTSFEKGNKKTTKQNPSTTTSGSTDTDLAAPSTRLEDSIPGARYVIQNKNGRSALVLVDEDGNPIRRKRDKEKGKSKSQMGHQQTMAESTNQYENSSQISVITQEMPSIPATRERSGAGSGAEIRRESSDAKALSPLKEAVPLRPASEHEHDHQYSRQHHDDENDIIPSNNGYPHQQSSSVTVSSSIFPSLKVPAQQSLTPQKPPHHYTHRSLPAPILRSSMDQSFPPLHPPASHSIPSRERDDGSTPITTPSTTGTESSQDISTLSSNDTHMQWGLFPPFPSPHTASMQTTNTLSTSSNGALSSRIIQHANSSGVQPTLRKTAPQGMIYSTYFANNSRLHMEYREFCPFSIPLPININMGWPVPMFTQDVDENDPELNSLMQMNEDINHDGDETLLGGSVRTALGPAGGPQITYGSTTATTNGRDGLTTSNGAPTSLNTLTIPSSSSSTTVGGSSSSGVPHLTISASSHQIHIRTPLTSPGIGSKTPVVRSPSSSPSRTGLPGGLSGPANVVGIGNTQLGASTPTVPDVLSSASFVVASRFDPMGQHLSQLSTSYTSRNDDATITTTLSQTANSLGDHSPLSYGAKPAVYLGSSSGSHSGGGGGSLKASSSGGVTQQSLAEYNNEHDAGCDDSDDDGMACDARGHHQRQQQQQQGQGLTKQSEGMTLTDERGVMLMARSTAHDRGNSIFHSRSGSAVSGTIAFGLGSDASSTTGVDIQLTDLGKAAKIKILTSLFSPFTSPSVQRSLAPSKMVSANLNHFDFTEVDMCVAIYNTLVFIGTLWHFQCHYTTLQSFIISTAALYRDNPFHNFIHGFNVFQFAYRMLVVTADPSLSFDDRLRGEGWIIPSFEASCLLIGALCHDLDHPGNTNAFEVHTQSALAYLHNGTSVLEHHHVNILSLLLEQPQTALFTNLPRSREIFAKRFLTRAILSTDMEYHMDTYKKLGNSDYVQLDYSSPAKAAESTQFLANLIIHTADVSGQLYPVEVALLWERAISEEFARQSCNEKRLGLSPLVFMMNLDKLYYRCKGQISFISHVLKPWWDELTRWFPALSENAQILASNLDHYQDIVNKIDYYNSTLVNSPVTASVEDGSRTSGGPDEPSNNRAPPPPPPTSVEDEFNPDGLCTQCEHDGEWIDVVCHQQRKALYSYIPTNNVIDDENTQMDAIYTIYHNYDPETGTITVDHTHLVPPEGMKWPVDPSKLNVPTICDKNMMRPQIQRVWKCQLKLPVIPRRYSHPGAQDDDDYANGGGPWVD